MEAFFLNDEDEYLEMEFSPQGMYFVLLLDGYRNNKLVNIPLFPNGPKTVSPCLDGKKRPQPCTDRWTSSVVIPREYLPHNTNRFLIKL